MTTAEFQEVIRQTGSYQTQLRRRGLRLPSFIASPLFHIGLVTIFADGHRRAARPAFETVEWPDFCFRMLRLTERLGGDVSVEGFEKTNQTDFPVVWVSNHMSPLETYLLPLVLLSYSRVMVILKESLAHYPLFGRIVRSINPIRVNRKSALEDLRKVLTVGREGLKQGRSVLVFPQGQRMPLFDPATFNTLGVKLACRAGVPIVPVAVRTDFLRLGRLHKDLVSVKAWRPVRMACGDPIYPDQSPQAMHRAATEFISTTLAQWESDDEVKLLAAPS